MPDAEIDRKSGIWSGFYSHWGGQYPFSLEIEFEGRTVKGVGVDGIGDFSISGTWDAITRKVQFLKQYIGAHNVDYEGTLSMDGFHMNGTYTVGTFSDNFSMSLSIFDD